MLFVVLALLLPDQWDLCVLRCLSVLAPTAVSWCTSVMCPCVSLPLRTKGFRLRRASYSALCPDVQ